MWRGRIKKCCIMVIWQQITIQEGIKLEKRRISMRGYMLKAN